MGNWLNGERENANFVRQGFLNLFTPSHCSVPRQDWQPPFWRNSLKPEDISTIELPISDDEILTALKSLKPYKASGLDGFMRFFPTFLDDCGNSVKAEVKQVFNC